MHANYTFSWLHSTATSHERVTVKIVQNLYQFKKILLVSHVYQYISHPYMITATFNLFNASLLNKNLNFFQNIFLSLTPNIWTVVYIQIFRLVDMSLKDRFLEKGRVVKVYNTALSLISVYSANGAAPLTCRHRRQKEARLLCHLLEWTRGLWSTRPSAHPGAYCPLSRLSPSASCPEHGCPAANCSPWF